MCVCSIVWGSNRHSHLHQGLLPFIADTTESYVFLSWSDPEKLEQADVVRDRCDSLSSGCHRAFILRSIQISLTESCSF